MNAFGDIFGEVAVEELLSVLLKCPSPQTELFEKEPEVQNFVRDIVPAQLERFGLPYDIDDFGNLTSTIGQGGRPGFAFFAYSMTHPANRMSDPYSADRLTDRFGATHLRGRGASEQKGALAAAILAMAALSRECDELQGPVTLCVSPSGETGRHDAAQLFVDGLNGKDLGGCIVVIGTGNAICVGNKGRADATIKVRGKAGHSSMPWAARNAIEGAMLVLDQIAALAPKGEHPELGRATVTPTSIHSWPSATHTVPDLVEIVVDRRLLPGDEAESAIEELRTTLSGLGDWDVSVEEGPVMYPSEASDETTLMQALIAGYDFLDERNPERIWSHGCIDAGFFTHLGIPAVMLGPGDQECWHTDDESVSLQAVKFCAELYRYTARQLLTLK